MTKKPKTPITLTFDDRISITIDVAPTFYSHDINTPQPPKSSDALLSLDYERHL